MMETCEICGQTVQRKEYYACTGWTIADIQGLDESISDEEATAFLNENDEAIVEAMLECGWHVIEILLNEWRRDKKE